MIPLNPGNGLEGPRRLEMGDDARVVAAAALGDVQVGELGNDARARVVAVGDDVDFNGVIFELEGLVCDVDWNAREPLV